MNKLPVPVLFIVKKTHNTHTITVHTSTSTRDPLPSLTLSPSLNHKKGYHESKRKGKAKGYAEGRA